jgi:hypothetical protein
VGAVVDLVQQRPGRADWRGLHRTRRRSEADKWSARGRLDVWTIRRGPALPQLVDEKEALIASSRMAVTPNPEGEQNGLRATMNWEARRSCLLAEHDHPIWVDSLDRYALSIRELVFESKRCRQQVQAVS